MADMYEQYYQSKLNEIKKKKDQGLADLATEEQGVNNTYTDLYNQLQSKQDEGKQTYYGQRNQAAVGNAQNVQQIRDWMAKNNLLQSGESADQLMRSNTDFNNNLGNINTNETNFNRDVLNQRGAANREQAQKIADILNRRRLTEDAYTGDENALRSEVELQRLQAQQQAEAEERQYQRQLALQKQAQAASAARSKSSSSSNKGLTYAQQRQLEQDQQKVNSQQITSNLMDYFNAWANGEAQDQEGRADRNQILGYIGNNAGALNNQGVDIDSLYKWASGNFNWYRDENGNWVKVGEE